MIVDGENVVVLFLEGWQKRMIQDFLGVDCDAWNIPVEEARNVMYGSPTISSGEYKRMYLTDCQMRELRDEAGVTCDYVELKKAIGTVRYGVFAE